MNAYADMFAMKSAFVSLFQPCICVEAMALIGMTVTQRA